MAQLRLFNMSRSRSLGSLSALRRATTPQTAFQTFSTAPLIVPFETSPAVVETVEGESGRVYTIQETLQDRGGKFGKIYLATDRARQVVLKEIPQNFGKRTSIYARIGDQPYVRGLLDTVPERRIFVFQYLSQNLLRLVRKGVPGPIAKRILKSALEGIAALHEKNVVHNDIKADNILVHVSPNAGNMAVEKVELVDLEDAVHLPPGTAVKGIQLGNVMWRSPESHAEGPMHTPSDMFSFGIVCLYTMAQIQPFEIDQARVPEGPDLLVAILYRQMSLFANPESFDGFLEYIGGEGDWVQLFKTIKSQFNKENPRTPFALWKDLEVEQVDLFKDLIVRLTNFDPMERMTASDALQHEWFKDVETI